MEEIDMSKKVKEDNILNEAERKILQVITLFNRPVTVSEVSAELDMPIRRVQEIFSQLQKKGNIVVYLSGNKRYYAPITSKDGLDAVLSQKYADIASSLENQYTEIKAENEDLRQQISRLYANILTLMGIFVAIFSLIVVNVNGMSIYLQKVTDSTDMFYVLLKLNIPLVLAIFFLVLMVKFLLSTSSKRRSK